MPLHVGERPTSNQGLRTQKALLSIPLLQQMLNQRTESIILSDRMIVLMMMLDKRRLRRTCSDYTLSVANRPQNLNLTSITIVKRLIWQVNKLIMIDVNDLLPCRCILLIHSNTPK